MPIKEPALIREHRPASSCLSHQLKCNFSGCSFPGSQCNSQEITLSADPLSRKVITETDGQSVIRSWTNCDRVNHNVTKNKRGQ